MWYTASTAMLIKTTYKKFFFKMGNGEWKMVTGKWQNREVEKRETGNCVSLWGLANVLITVRWLNPYFPL